MKSFLSVGHSFFIFLAKNGSCYEIFGSQHIHCFCRAWLINSRGLANKVKNAARSSAYQIKDCGANRDCPNCHFVIDNSDVSWNFSSIQYSNDYLVFFFFKYDYLAGVTRLNMHERMNLLFFISKQTILYISKNLFQVPFLLTMNFI